MIFYEHYTGCWNSGWISFYDYFDEIKIIDDEKFRKYKDLNIQGFSIVFFELFVVVCKLPIKTLTDDFNRLHSVSEPCLQWRDNQNQYAIHGVMFEKELWEKVVNRTITPKELLLIQNTDQRFVAMNHYGFDSLIDNMEKRLIDKSKYGNELYITMFNNIELKFLIYPDIDFPDKKRMSFVKPDIKSASDAMAWKHNCTEEEYYNAKILEKWI